MKSEKYIKKKLVFETMLSIKSFEKKPTNGGTPAREKIKIVIANK